MKEQSQHTDAELREAFDAARDLARKNIAADHADEMLRQISRTIERLQESGADISVEVRHGGSSNAYDMAYTSASTSAAPISSGTVEAHGFIRIGQNTHLFAVATKLGDKQVEKLFLSKYAVTNEGGRMKPVTGGGSRTQSIIYANAFDFAEDPEALKKFEKTLIANIAEYEAVMENDVSGVFNKPAPLKGNTKPVLKLKP